MDEGLGLEDMTLRVPLFGLEKCRLAHSYREAFALLLVETRSKGISPDVGSTVTSAVMALADGVNSFAMGFVPSTERRLSMNTEVRDVRGGNWFHGKTHGVSNRIHNV